MNQHIQKRYNISLFLLSCSDKVPPPANGNLPTYMTPHTQLFPDPAYYPNHLADGKWYVIIAPGGLHRYSNKVHPLRLALLSVQPASIFYFVQGPFFSGISPILVVPELQLLPPNYLPVQKR